MTVVDRIMGSTRPSAKGRAQSPRPGEYMTPGYVAEEVVDEVAGFVKGL